MNIKLNTLFIIAAAGLCSCTGDPSRGGIFWSESKAVARQNTLVAQVNAKEAQLASAKVRLAANERELARLKAELAEKERRLATLSSNPEADNAAEIAKLKKEIVAVRREIRAMGGSY